MGVFFVSRCRLGSLLCMIMLSRYRLCFFCTAVFFIVAGLKGVGVGYLLRDLWLLLYFILCLNVIFIIFKGF